MRWFWIPEKKKKDFSFSNIESTVAFSHPVSLKAIIEVLLILMWCMWPKGRIVLFIRLMASLMKLLSLNKSYVFIGWRRHCGLCYIGRWNWHKWTAEIWEEDRLRSVNRGGTLRYEGHFRQSRRRKSDIQFGESSDNVLSPMIFSSLGNLPHYPTWAPRNLYLLFSWEEGRRERVWKVLLFGTHIWTRI